jgi:hypothetical protein
MKLVDVATVIRRVNSLLLVAESGELAPVTEGLNELRSGLEFYEEANPHTIAPGVKKRRASKRKRRRGIKA